MKKSILTFAFVATAGLLFSQAQAAEQGAVWEFAGGSADTAATVNFDGISADPAEMVGTPDPDSSVGNGFPPGSPTWFWLFDTDLGGVSVGATETSDEFDFIGVSLDYASTLGGPESLTANINGVETTVDLITNQLWHNLTFALPTGTSDTVVASFVFSETQGPGTLASIDNVAVLVPEPGTYVLFALGGVMLFGYVQRRRRK